MTRTYADAGVLIGGFRGVGMLGGDALAVLGDPGREFVGSAFLRLEILPKALYHRNAIEVAFYEAFFARVVAWAEPNAEMVEQAALEAARSGLNALDALHVAAAGLLGATELVTTEGARKPIHRVTSVKVVRI